MTVNDSDRVVANGDVLRVVQVTDTHVTSHSGATTVLGLLAEMDGGDPMEHLDAVIEGISGLVPAPDVIVGTGDLADTGDAAAYGRWRDAFLPLGVPVLVLPGNHDLADVFDAHLVGDGVDAAASTRHGSWQFLFVRTGNTEWGEIDPAHIDELRAELRDSDADHVFVWIHHPPVGQHLAGHETLVREDLRAVIDGDDRVRAIAAGHVHVAAEHEFDGIPVFLAPSTYTGRPAPGFRSFELHADGTVMSEVHHIEARFTFDESQIDRLRTMATERFRAEPEARRGAAAHARAEVEGWRDAITSRSTAAGRPF